MNDPQAHPNHRKQADQYLIECEKSNFIFLAYLLEIYQQANNDQVIKLQALLCFNNVVKRNWNNKKLNKNSKNFEGDKSKIKQKLIIYLQNSNTVCRRSLLDIIIFIAKHDFPHNFSVLHIYILNVLQSINNSNYTIVPRTLENLKAVKEIYKQLIAKKTFVNKKIFYEINFNLIVQSFKIFNHYNNQLEKFNNFNEAQLKTIRTNQKILIMLLITGNSEIIDDQNFVNLVATLYQSLQKTVLICLNNVMNNRFRQSIEKIIYNLLYYLGFLQSNHPYIFTLTLREYIQLHLYLFQNYQSFKNKLILKYTIINLNKIIKCFNYFADENMFMASIHSKSKAVNCINFRARCHAIYYEMMTDNSIQSILNKILVSILNIRQENYDINVGIQQEQYKIEEKQNNIYNLTIYLIQSILTRFSPFPLLVLKNLIDKSLDSNFQGLNQQIKNNIFTVVAILPKVCKGSNVEFLNQIPIIQIIQYIHTTGKGKQKFALVCCRWINKFKKQQIENIVAVLLNYIEHQQSMQILLQCCLAIKTIVIQKSTVIDLSFAVQKVIPVVIKIIAQSQNTQIIWSMISLISTLISKIQCNFDFLLKVFTCQLLRKLLQTQQQIIIQALCDMFKNLICVFPRNVPISIIYSLVIDFLNNNLNRSGNTSFESILNLWYITVREYSSIQNLDQQMYNLFQVYYVKLSFTQNPILLYILEEYILLGLVFSSIDYYLNILNDFYEESQDKEEQINLKIICLSVHITLISKYGIDKAHRNELLIKYLRDFKLYSENNSQIKGASALRTSLLTIVNRYIILFKPEFLKFVQQIGFTRQILFNSWFINMNSLTSRMACKINAIALLSILNELPEEVINCKLEFILKILLPQIQFFCQTVIQKDNQLAIGKIGRSPTFRLNENTLSDRKQEIRRYGVFQNINLKELFQNQIQRLFSYLSIDQSKLNWLVQDKSIIQRLFQILK